MSMDATTPMDDGMVAEQGVKSDRVVRVYEAGTEANNELCPAARATQLTEDQPDRLRQSPSSIVIASLEEVDAAITDHVDESVLFGETAGPGARGQVLQRFGLAESGERVSEHGLDEVDGPQGRAPVRGDPVPKILEELDLEHGLPLPRCKCGFTALLRQRRAAL